MSPLNGLEASDPSGLDRRVVAVKVDNHADARPQSGLEQAPAVFEIQVEGGISRFIALFHDTDVEFVGPMRSARPTDIGMIKPLGATFFVSGMQPWVRELYQEAGIYLLEDVRPASFRNPDRSAPHNLYANTVLVREEADRMEFPDEPPPPLFTWGVPSGGSPAREIEFDWSSGFQVIWRWDGSRYLRFTGSEPHNSTSPDFETEEQLSADTLVVLFGERYSARSAGSGTAVPATETVGTGSALVFSDGIVHEGTWARDSIEETFTLSGPNGQALPVPPGKLWVVVFPDDRTVEWS